MKSGHLREIYAPGLPTGAPAEAGSAPEPSSHPDPRRKEPPVAIHRSWRSLVVQFPYRIWLIGLPLCVSMGYSASMLEGGSVAALLNRSCLLISILIVMLTAVRMLWVWLDCRHYVSLTHLTSISGLSLWGKDRTDIPFQDIMGVRTNQSTLERVLNVGAIIVWTASVERPDIIMKGIGSPERVARMLRQRIQGVRRDTGQHAPPPPRMDDHSFASGPP
jgi:membrane protein YdbS with pleckstrin-like domain